MQDDQLLRYSRQIMLPQIDIQGQEKLLQSAVLIIGLGGLGSPVALYLAASGVGKLVLSDPDTVDMSNLQRQIVHHTASVQQLKVDSARERLLAINPEISVYTVPYALDQTALLAQLQQVDMVVDCTDNLASRFMINQACVNAKKPLVSGAAIRWEGQISVFDTRLSHSPCYHCFYGSVGEVEQSCSTNGVIGPLLGVIGSMQAIEVLKLLCGVGEQLVGRVLLFDALNMDWTEIKLPRYTQCPICRHREYET